MVIVSVIMKISLLQTKQNLLYDFEHPSYIPPKIRMELASENVLRTVQMAECAAKDRCDYIITTEAVNFTGVPMDIETFNVVEPFGGWSFELFSGIAKKYAVNICAGLYNARYGMVYNSAVMFDRGGCIEMVYDKVNLAGDENKMITPGKEYMVIDSEFGKIAPLVCWDMQCGAAEQAARMNADVIFCPTWGWENGYGIPCAADNEVCIAAAMAVPYNGSISGARSPSEIIDRQGNIIAVGSRTDDCIISAELI